MSEIADANVSCSVENALYHADWLLRYALDRIGFAGSGDGRLYHPGVRSHAMASQTQAKAAMLLADPKNDQVRV
jgi:hypothetical protein